MLLPMSACKSQLEVSLYIAPFLAENAVHHAVPHSSITPRLMMTDNSVELRAKCFDRTL
jgi:hypothetical protein